MPGSTQAQLVATPSAISPPVGSTAPVSLTISESGYTGAFTESDTCSALASVTAPAQPQGPSATYTVQPLANQAGTCSITVSDANGQQTQVTVTLTTASISVN